RAVIDEQVDVKLHAAGDLVKGDVQIVEGELDALQPRAGGRAAIERAMAADVYEVALVVPVAHRLDRPRVGPSGEDALVAVALLDAQRQLLGTQARDAPGELLLVWKRHAEAPHRDLREHVPVVVQGRVDVDCYAHRGE